MRRGDGDIARYTRQRLGVTTPGDLRRQFEDATRYRRDESDEPIPFNRPAQYPPGMNVDTGLVTAGVSGRTQARYLGQPPDDIGLVLVRLNVTTPVSAAGFMWAEIGIGTSEDFNFGSAASISLNGYTAVGSTFNTTGVKDTEVAVNIARGQHVWLLFGSEATTPFEVTGALGDTLGTGITQLATTTRPSTMADPTTFTVSTNPSTSPLLAFQW